MKHPIPMSVSTVNSSFDVASKPDFPTIEAFVNDCFLNSIHCITDMATIKLINDFDGYAKKLHCIENLQFLIDIYAYEHLYNQHFSLMNRLNTPSPLRSATPSRASSLLASQANPNVEDDLVFADDINEAPQDNPWDSLKEKTCVSDSEEEHDTSELSKEARAELTAKWNKIIDDFILEDSKLQINLSDKSFTEIEEEDKIDRVHDPIVLLNSKNEIMQLLNENCYHSFIKKLKNCNKCCDASCTSPKTGCGSNKSAQKSQGKDYSMYIKDGDDSSPACSVCCNSAPAPISPCLSPAGTKKKNNAASSASSLTNILGHLKLNTHAFSSSPLSSSFNSLSSSPEDKTSLSKFKLWSKKVEEKKPSKIVP